MPEEDSNPDFWDAGAVLHQLSHQANWELVIVWVDEKPIESGHTCDVITVDFTLLYRAAFPSSLACWVLAYEVANYVVN